MQSLVYRTVSQTLATLNSMNISIERTKNRSGTLLFSAIESPGVDNEYYKQLNRASLDFIFQGPHWQLSYLPNKKNRKWNKKFTSPPETYFRDLSSVQKWRAKNVPLLPSLIGCKKDLKTRWISLPTDITRRPDLTIMRMAVLHDCTTENTVTLNSLTTALKYWSDPRNFAK